MPPRALPLNHLRLKEADDRFSQGVLKAEHGIPEAESIRRALGVYLAEKGVKPTQKGARRPKKRK